MYRCYMCKKIIEKIEENRIICPYCGCRILEKVRPPIAKILKAR